ncbi:MAG TPA: cupin domain-containing protein, partial [Gemmatimonadales bacterium]|nr:cupin domain-containing protein [Gemmatimonadales bacterium]
MHLRAAELIDRLGMRPHPEGGHFCEVYRSTSTVAPDDSRPPRAAVTTIYFLLQSGEHSALHRVLSDEVWHFYEGDSLELVWWDATSDTLSQAALGEVDPTGTTRPVAVVPAGWWQTARTAG